MKFIKKVSAILLGVMLLTGVFCGTAGADLFALAENGESRSVVVISPGADAVERHAAGELCYFLSRVTGAEIRQSESPLPGKFSIWVGTPGVNPGISSPEILKLVNGLSGQGFLLYADEDGLVIAGSEPLGVLFGAYAFLEEHVGMRWFHPGPEGEHCPDRPYLAIGGIKDVQNPVFHVRDVGLAATAVSAEMTDTWDWIARNRMQSRLHPRHREEYAKRGALTAGGGHILSRIISDDLFDEHPEYFALYDGERRRQYGHRGQPCTTHPDVIDLTVEYILDWFEENPGGRFTLNNNDWPRFCECENCLSLDHPGEKGRSGGEVATRFFIFKDEVARRVLEVNPDADIRTLAYQRFRLHPLGIRPDERIQVVMCDHGRCFAHSLDDPACEANSWFRDMFEGWAGFNNPRGYFPYYNVPGAGGQGGVIPALPIERIVADDILYMHRLGHTHYNIRAMPPDGSYTHTGGRYDTPSRWHYWRANFPSIYIASKLAWDPEQDFYELMRDLNEKYYGPAAEAMSEYRALLRECWDGMPGHFIYGTPFVMTGRAMTAPNAVRDLTALLDRAAEAAAGDPLLTGRVEYDRMIFENSWVLLHEQYSKRPVGDIQAARRSSSIKIDGILDEPDWRSYERVTGFIRRDTGQPAGAQTYVRLLYDEDYLYVALEMEEPLMDDIVTDAAGRDLSRIWDDDTIQLFIDPDGEGLRYIHYAINPAGVFRDSECASGAPPSGDPQYDTGAEIAARKDAGKWTVEMKVSAESLGGIIREGGRWTMDVGRVRKPVSEVSSWMDGVFHSPETFRGVAFSKPVIRNGLFEDVVVMDTDLLLRQFGASRWEYGNKPPAMARHWRLNSSGPGIATVLTEEAYSGRNALQIEDGYLFQVMDREFSEGDVLRISFAARGDGVINMRTYNYTRDPETGRIIHTNPERSVPLSERFSQVNFELDSGWSRHEVVYRHPAGYPPVVALAFHIDGKAALDDVYAVPVD